MKFTDNANLTTLLLNAPVWFKIITDDNRSFTLKLRVPTITDLFTNSSLQIMLGILNTPIEQLGTKFGAVTNLTHYNLPLLLKLHEEQPVYQEYLEHLTEGFKIFDLDFKVEHNKMLINDIAFNEEGFNYLRGLILQLSKIKTKQDTLLEQDPRYKASQDMIARIKKQGNNQMQDTDKNFEKNFIVLIWEFGLTPEEIYNLNIYQYETILAYTSNAVSTKIGTVAAGNGLTKKFKYITEGGKRNGK